MNKSALNARLLSAAEFVRQNATFADIGTDHAYLPLFLLDEGRINYAYCCDINEGPLDSARRNAAERGREDRMSFVLTDGAAVLSDKGITDYAICGMGGELIAEIIERAPHLRDESINLILQPMTKQEHLRRYLISSGFDIISESYSYDAGKYYVCLLVKFSGKYREITTLESVVGCYDTKFFGNDFRLSYLDAKLRSYERALLGKAEAGIDTDEDREIVSLLKNYINSL